MMCPGFTRRIWQDCTSMKRVDTSQYLAEDHVGRLKRNPCLSGTWTLRLLGRVRLKQLNRSDLIN
jgi:hypothetical protein